MTISDIPKMDPVVKAAWLEALPKHTPAWGVLKKVDDDGNESHCCLGVICELAVKAGVIKKVPSTKQKGHYSRVGFYLPQKVAKWAGIPDVSRILPGEGIEGTVQGDLSGLNDEAVGGTFGHDEPTPNKAPYEDVIKYIKENL